MTTEVFSVESMLNFRYKWVNRNQCTFFFCTGMNMLGSQTNDYDTWWSNGVRGTVYQGEPQTNVSLDIGSLEVLFCYADISVYIIFHQIFCNNDWITFSHMIIMSVHIW